MSKRPLPLSRVYRLLEPGPVVLVTTARRGKPNAMAMSWHTMMEFEPPLVGCVISNRDYPFDTLKVTRECVIAIPTVEIAKKVVGCGNTSARPSLPSATPISNAELPTDEWWPSTAFWCWKWSPRGSIPHARIRARSTLEAWGSS